MSLPRGLCRSLQDLSLALPMVTGWIGFTRQVIKMMFLPGSPIHRVSIIQNPPHHFPPVFQLVG